MSSQSMKNKHILLINPWIYDVAAFDLWVKPIGLLTLASVLRNAGYQISLIDCLDRFHPALQAQPDIYPPQNKKYGTGKFIRQKVKKTRHPRRCPPLLLPIRLADIPVQKGTRKIARGRRDTCHQRNDVLGTMVR